MTDETKSLRWETSDTEGYLWCGHTKLGYICREPGGWTVCPIMPPWRDSYGHKDKRVAQDVMEGIVREADDAALEVAVRAAIGVRFLPVVQEIAAERQRQIEVEGWSVHHDDEHGNAQLARAAASYALGTAAMTYADPDSQKMFAVDANRIWPWASEWQKPTTPRRDLIKAAALLVAEIERLDRRDASMAREAGDVAEASTEGAK